jgi:hypothetical protein
MCVPKMMALFVLFCAILLTSCASSKVAWVPPVAIETRVAMPEMPSDMLSCEMPFPDAIRMDSDVADYLARLHYAARALSVN